MKQGYRKGIIHSNTEIASNVYEIKLSPYYSKQAGDKEKTLDFKGKPGQFYMLRGWELDPLLARPISICDLSEGIITFIYEVVGRGTRIISNLRSGDTLEVLGPLGSGFNFKTEEKVAFVSGGAGMAPLFYLAKQWKKGQGDFYCGFPSEVYYLDKIRNITNAVYISTDDGNMGHKGFVTELLIPEKYDMVVTCGPTPMMRKVVEMCKKVDVPVYLSTEARMACGIGTCLACTVETASGMERGCVEGPVFSGKEVVFND